jgi:hypothetical protein
MARTVSIRQSLDFILMSQTWAQVKGPSGITNPSRDYTECP